MFRYFGVLLLFSWASAGVVQVNKCPNIESTGELVHVIIPSCGVPPCQLKKGETYTVEMDFDVMHDTRNLTVILHGIIGPIEVLWPGVKSAGCEDMLIGRCPLKAWDYVTYGVELYVEPFYPSVSVTIQWQMRSDDGRVIWCFQLPARVY